MILWGKGGAYAPLGRDSWSMEHVLWKPENSCESQFYRVGLNWGFLLPDDASSYQVDIKLDSTINEASCDGNKSKHEINLFPLHVFST